MTHSSLELPLIWPTFIGNGQQPDPPPFERLAHTATAVFGVAPSVTDAGIRAFRDWFLRNAALKASIIAVVSPGCSTSQLDLESLRSLTASLDGRLKVRVLPVDSVEEEPCTALCFTNTDSTVTHFSFGPCRDLGFSVAPRHSNFLFLAEARLLEAFRVRFDHLWSQSCELRLPSAAGIPRLIPVPGSEEGWRQWKAYTASLNSGLPPTPAMPGSTTLGELKPTLSDVSSSADPERAPSEEAADSRSPTLAIGVQKLDDLAKWIAELYSKGRLVSIDKFSRIPPLDAPLRPAWFGENEELQTGGASRKVTMRVSVVDAATLKEIEGYRSSVRTLLEKFSFKLADNMRWMPNTAKLLFEAELDRVNQDGKKQIAALLKEEPEKFVESRRASLIRDIDELLSQAGRDVRVTEQIAEKVVVSLKERLAKARGANLMPTFSFTDISFNRTENSLASPWGQAHSLLAGIAAFPRNALTSGFFFRGLSTEKRDLLEAMDVASDALLRHTSPIDLPDQCKEGLDFLKALQSAAVESRARCELIRELLNGTPVQSLEKKLEQMKREKETD